MSVESTQQSGQAILADKVRGMVSGLDTNARASLLAQLEKAALQGQSPPGGNLIIEELRASLRGKGPVSSQRQFDAKRLFFDPATPFLITESTNEKTPGRIRRTSLNNLWVWFSRDLLPQEFSNYEKSVIPLLIAGSIEKARGLTLDLYAKVREACKELKSPDHHRSDGIQRITAQMGGPKVYDDLIAFLQVLTHRDMLRALLVRLGQEKRALQGENIAEIIAMVNAIREKAPEALPYALVLVMSRLMQPSHLLKIIVAAAETDNAAKINSHPLAIIVDIVIGEMERILRRTAVSFRRADHHDAIAAIREFQMLVRGLSTEIDFSTPNPWAKQIAAHRAEISRVVTREIEMLPKRIRDVMGLRDAHAKIDPAEVATLEIELELLDTVRACANELAINELAIRLQNDVRSIIDTGVSGLLERMRGPNVDLEAMKPQIDASIRIASRVFGSGYAQLLQKAADMASQEPTKNRA